MNGDSARNHELAEYSLGIAFWNAEHDPFQAVLPSLSAVRG